MSGLALCADYWRCMRFGRASAEVSRAGTSGRQDRRVASDPVGVGPKSKRWWATGSSITPPWRGRARRPVRSPATGPGPPRQTGRGDLRRPNALFGGVGGLGERRRGARARLPRHLSSRRVLTPRRQHSATPRGRPASGVPGADLIRGLATGLRDPDRPPRAICCTSTRLTTSPTSAPRWPPVSARCCGCDAETSTKRSGRRCT